MAPTATVSLQETATSPGDRPTLPRSGACAATLPASHSHDVIMFGGYTEEQPPAGGAAAAAQRAPTNEAWLFSAAAGAWTRVTYSSEEVPATRLAAQCVVVGDKLWLIGGWDSSVTGPDAFLGDVWTLDLRTWAWQRQQLAGEPLQGISRFQAVADGARVLLHTHRCDDHILALHTDARPLPRLERVPVKGPAPSSRGLHSLVKVGDALFLYGGAPQKGPMLDDLWRLDLGSMEWARLEPGGAAPPHARCSTAAAAVGDAILYVGGAYYGAAGGLEMLRDAHVYDTRANRWLATAVAGGDAALPAGRNAAVMAPLPDRGGGGGGSAPRARLLLAGGWRAFVETYNDTFLVDLSVEAAAAQ